MQILAVDDDPIALEALLCMLRKSGHDVLVAHDGEEALEVLQNSTCRMVISDWIMPRMTGLDLCRIIRATDLPAYVYFILLTSKEGIQSVVEGLSAGADDFIAKPFHPEELRVRIRAGERVLALETRDMAIFAMAKLAESRDPDTGAHLDRVRTFSRLLAQSLSTMKGYAEVIDAEYVRLIFQTSPLHDIGKVGIPDSVLLKPGRLNDHEFDIMKTHTTIGAETLEAALRQYPGARFLHMARDIALTHHERFDGTGYPDGLAGTDIPLCGRIVALADVYDALTSKRVYKGAYTHDVARDIIVGDSGKHFDPDIVTAFLEAESSFQQANEQFSVQEELVAV